MITFPNQHTSSDPEMVDHIIRIVGKAVSSAVVPHVTTQSDLLSAIFTILHRMLEVSRSMEEPGDHEHNTREIGNILTNFLLEFGTPSVKH